MELTPAQPSKAHPAQRSTPVMPRFVGGTHSFLHTVDSALVTLSALQIAPERITLRRAGRETHPDGTVVRQRPAAGTPLTPDVAVELTVAGLGFTHALPVGMWDSGGERAAGTREMLEPLDDPLEKLHHWFREGAPMFRRSSGDSRACARWLSLFGVEADLWPQETWFPLASLMAELPQLACRPEGCTVALATVLGLPVRRITYRPSFLALGDDAVSSLGRRSSQLGIDLVVGDVVEDVAAAVIEIGPVSLATYERFAESAEGATLLGRLLRLLMPLLSDYEIAWSVDDRQQPPRLGIAVANSRLGVNTHLGRGAWPPTAPVAKDSEGANQ